MASFSQLIHKYAPRERSSLCCSVCCSSGFVVSMPGGPGGAPRRAPVYFQVGGVLVFSPHMSNARFWIAMRANRLQSSVFSSPSFVVLGRSCSAVLNAGHPTPVPENRLKTENFHYARTGRRCQESGGSEIGLGNKTDNVAYCPDRSHPSVKPLPTSPPSPW